MFLCIAVSSRVVRPFLLVWMGTVAPTIVFLQCKLHGRKLILVKDTLEIHVKFKEKAPTVYCTFQLQTKKIAATKHDNIP